MYTWKDIIDDFAQNKHRINTNIIEPWVTKYLQPEIDVYKVQNLVPSLTTSNLYSWQCSSIQTQDFIPPTIFNYLSLALKGLSTIKYYASRYEAILDCLLAIYRFSITENDTKVIQETFDDKENNL